MSRRAAITGWGHYVPEKVLTNAHLEELVETSDEWIRSRTGIRERRLAGPDETTASMSAIAAQRALACAGLHASDIDLLICATTTPDHLLPATACLIQQRIGAARAAAFDMNSACTGFMSALVVGSQFIMAGTYRRILVIGGETLSRFTDWNDRTTCVLFGDGAGAVVLEATSEHFGVLATELGCRGDNQHLLAIEGGGCARPASAESVSQGDHYIRMRGNDIFKLAVRSMRQTACRALARAGLVAEDIHAVIPHQANQRILDATRLALALPEEKFFINLDRYGNTGSASVPIALSEFLDSGQVHAGDNLLLAAFGGGLTWGSAVVRHANIDAVLTERRHRAAPTSESEELALASFVNAPSPVHAVE
jgi:3-oxoacyl-[acyl-carrier-protein] synthase-3